MSSFQTILSLFCSKFESTEIFTKAQDLFALKPFKLKSFTPQKSLLQYSEIKSKYEHKEIDVWRDEWHKNQRKLFIEFLICYAKLHQTSPENIREGEWQLLSQIFFHKNPMFLKFQGLSILKAVKKITWTQEDDELIRANVSQQGEGNWNQISKTIFFLSQTQKFFSPKQIRQRWFNHLSCTIRRCEWSIQEDLIILEHVLSSSKRWCQIVKILGGSRTEHMIKNRYKFLVKNPSTDRPTKELRVVKLIIAKIKKKKSMMKKKQKVENFSSASLSLNNHSERGLKIPNNFDSNSYARPNAITQCHNKQEGQINTIHFIDHACSNYNMLIPFSADHTLLVNNTVENSPMCMNFTPQTYYSSPIMVSPMLLALSQNNFTSNMSTWQTWFGQLHSVKETMMAFSNQKLEQI